MKDLEEMVSKPISFDVPHIMDHEASEAIVVTDVEVPDDGRKLPPGAIAALESAGMNPAEYEIKSAWPSHDGTMQYSFKLKRGAEAATAALTDAELEMVLMSQRIERSAQDGSQVPSRTALVLLGDMQAGKIDGDGITGTLARLESTLDGAFDHIEKRIREDGDIEKITIAFLGDHVEGFVSQNGANAWRTPMPLTEQIRITRRTMLYAMELFTELGLPLQMVAIPGNHGDAVRFEGKGVTRYDDSLDTESLIAVADAARISERYKDVQFFVPQTDELSVGLDCSGTYVMFTHGHMAKGQVKLMEWVKGQAFNRDSPYAGADLVACGHWHNFDIQSDSDRMVLTVPALESESTWYRHRAGSTGDPGLVVAFTGQGRTDEIKLIR